MPSQTFIETDCTIEHNRRIFSAGGASICGDRIVCYAKAPENTECTRDWVPQYGWTFTDWHGNKLGSGSVTSHWRIHSIWGTRMYAFDVTLTDGRRFHCRGQGDGMIATGKLYKGSN